MKNTARLLPLTVFLLSACADMHPEHTSIEQSLANATANPVITDPTLTAQTETRSPGSLWRPGANHFFKDSRARKTGDIVTVVVSEQADATVKAKTDATRNNTDTSGITNLLNLEGKLTSRGMAPGVANLLSTDSSRDFAGDASTDRKDQLNGRVAAVVTQVLPNGYMVIKGHREVMVNYEMQKMTLEGIIRPDDIAADNTIPSEKVAEARIAYAGKGIIDEAQTSQYGNRFLNKWLPF